MLPFNAADTEFADKVANFHLHCPVMLNEKWTISTAWNVLLFWRRLQLRKKKKLTGRIALSCCLPGLRLVGTAPVLRLRHCARVHAELKFKIFRLHQR